MELLDNALNNNDFDDSLFKAKIAVCGLGGGGSNTIQRMVKQGIKSASFIAVNTDSKHMELMAPGDFYFNVLVYPHMIIREHRMATGAGADRISQGMSHAFGKPVSVAARLREGQPIFMVKTRAKNVPHVREAFRRASSKLSGLYKLNIEQAQQAKN